MAEPNQYAFDQNRDEDAVVVPQELQEAAAERVPEAGEEIERAGQGRNLVEAYYILEIIGISISLVFFLAGIVYAILKWRGNYADGIAALNRLYEIVMLLLTFRRR